jgi:hypothetical protein
MALVLPLPIGESFAFHVVLSTRGTPSSGQFAWIYWNSSEPRGDWHAVVEVDQDEAKFQPIHNLPYEIEIGAMTAGCTPAWSHTSSR